MKAFAQLLKNLRYYFGLRAVAFRVLFVVHGFQPWTPRKIQKALLSLRINYLNFLRNCAFAIMFVLCVSSLFANENYSIQDREEIKVIGIVMQTTNANGQSAKDIPQFLQKFFQEDIVSKIPNKKGRDLLCIYTK